MSLVALTRRSSSSPSARSVARGSRDISDHHVIIKATRINTGLDELIGRKKIKCLGTYFVAFQESDNGSRGQYEIGLRFGSITVVFY